MHTTMQNDKTHLNKHQNNSITGNQDTLQLWSFYISQICH